MNKVTVLLSLFVTLATSFARATPPNEIMNCEGIRVVTYNHVVLGVSIPTFYIYDVNDVESYEPTVKKNSEGGDLEVKNFRGEGGTLRLTVVDYPQVYGASINGSTDYLLCERSK